MTGLSLRADIAQAAQRRGLLAPSGRTNVLETPWTIYHRRDVPAAGQTNFVFFNEVRGQGITNLDVQGQLPANQVFSCEGIKFGFLPGFDRTGQRLGIAAPSSAQALGSALNRSSVIASSLDPAALLPLWQEKARELLMQGAVQFIINGRTVLDAYGLATFPEGRGVLGDANQAISATFTAAAGLASVRSGVYNGAPLASNVFRFASKIGIFPGQAFSVGVTYNRAVNFNEADVGPLVGLSAVTAGTLTCELFGTLIQGVS